MLEVLRRYREMRPASVLVIVAALLVGGYNVHRALGFGLHVEHTSLAAENLPSSGNSSRAQFGDSVFTKADASTLKSVEKLTRIEELQVGERIRSDAPTEEFDRQFGTDIIRSDWRKVTLVAPKRDGSSADVVLLRPLPWLTEQQAEVGGNVFISVPECSIDGHANVLAIEPCPPIELAGDLGGRVITGTFRHQVSASISLSIAGQAEPILCTGNHPFWSEDRQDFARADSLQPDETLRTTTGTTTVASLGHIPGSTPVYNLEIHGTHVYHVGTSGVLVHNSGDCEEFLTLLHATTLESAERIAANGLDAVSAVKASVNSSDDFFTHVWEFSRNADEMNHALAVWAGRYPRAIARRNFAKSNIPENFFCIHYKRRKCPLPESLLSQGQRTLNSFDTKDLHQEVIIPAAELAFHGEAFFAGVLLQEG